MALHMKSVKKLKAEGHMLVAMNVFSQGKHLLKPGSFTGIDGKYPILN